MVPGLFSGRAEVNYLSTLRFSGDVLDAIARAVPGVEVVQRTLESSDDLTAEEWAEVDVLHTSAVFPDPAVATRLRWIQLDTSGAEHLREHPVWASAVPVTTLGGVSPVPLAEYVLWAILGAAHRLPGLLRVKESGHWPDPLTRWDTLMPAPVRGATVGIIGYGRIGREIGRLAGAFGMHVLGLSRSAGTEKRGAHHYGAASDNDDGVELLGPAGLPDLMARSDYVVVVVPLTDETAKMVDADALERAKPGSVLINVARGGIVDEHALRDQLRSGRIRAAVLDVFDCEPLAPDDAWWTEPNVFVTPHVSGLSPAYEAGVLDIVGENLRRLVRGEALMNLVDRARGY